LNHQYIKYLQHELLTKEATYFLIDEYNSSLTSLERKTKIEEILIRHNFKLIYRLSLRFCNSHSGIELDDCIQVASLAIGKAASKFDTSRGYCFSTCYFNWCASYLGREWMKTNRTIRIPCHAQDSYRRILKYKKEFEAEFLRLPTTKEISNALNIPAETITNIVKAHRNITSLNIPIYNDEGGSTQLLELISSSLETPNENLYSIELNQHIEHLLSKLNSIEREALVLRYYENLTLEQVAAKLGVKRERARAIINIAIRHIRHLDVSVLKSFITH
jgi:RNA polymerase primary sigma factor